MKIEMLASIFRSVITMDIAIARLDLLALTAEILVQVVASILVMFVGHQQPQNVCVLRYVSFLF